MRLLRGLSRSADRRERDSSNARVGVVSRGGCLPPRDRSTNEYLVGAGREEGSVEGSVAAGRQEFAERIKRLVDEHQVYLTCAW